MGIERKASALRLLPAASFGGFLLDSSWEPCRRVVGRVISAAWYVRNCVKCTEGRNVRGWLHMPEWDTSQPADAGF